mmetsp:Transcript_26074/g.64585  ORF Transcript_26074/g.64585 Transcript_26074/m.64585 type:complete len:316 (-) Transcript_26074:1431-2378(-)
MFAGWCSMSPRLNIAFRMHLLACFQDVQHSARASLGHPISQAWPVLITVMDAKTSSNCARVAWRQSGGGRSPTLDAPCWLLECMRFSARDGRAAQEILRYRLPPTPLRQAVEGGLDVLDIGSRVCKGRRRRGGGIGDAGAHSSRSLRPTAARAPARRIRDGDGPCALQIEGAVRVAAREALPEVGLPVELVLRLVLCRVEHEGGAVHAAQRRADQRDDRRDALGARLSDARARDLHSQRLGEAAEDRRAADELLVARLVGRRRGALVGARRLARRRAVHARLPARAHVALLQQLLRRLLPRRGGLLRDRLRDERG